MRRSIRATALLLGACAASAAAQEGTSLAGCYDLSLGEASWTEGPDSLTYRPPPRIELDTTRVERSEGAYRILVPERSVGSPHWSAEWTPFGDSLRLSWGAGLGTVTEGLTARVQVTPSGFEGAARAFSDVGGLEGPSRALAGVRVPCGTPPTFPGEDARALSRSIAFEDRLPLVLGERFPSDVPRSLLRPGLGIGNPLEGAASGRWAGNDGLEIRVDLRGRVGRITLTYPPTVTPEMLAERAVAEWGPPTLSAPGSWHWRTRGESASVRTEGGRAALLLWDPTVG